MDTLARNRFTSITTRTIHAAMALTLATAFVGCGDDNEGGDANQLAEELIEAAATANSAEAEGGSAGPSITLPDLGLGDAESGDAGSGGAGSDDGTPVDEQLIETRQIDKTVWWGGFMITVASVEGSSNALGSTINLTVALENQTADVKSLSRQDIVLTVGTQSFLSGLAQTPTVPSMSRNDAVLDFFVDDEFVLDDAVLTFGQPDANQSVVPLGDDPAISSEPKQLDMDATLTTPLLTIQLTGGTLEPSYASGQKGTFIVRVPLRATFKGEGPGGDLMLPDQFALRSPSGSSVIASPVAPGDLAAEALYPGVELVGAQIAFLINGSEAGTWTITYTDNADATASADFSVD